LPVTFSVQTIYRIVSHCEPGPRAPSFRGPERLSCNLLLCHHKQNGANSNVGIEYRINSEFYT